MIKEIKYNGFTATPSDYECPDGELSAAINILPEEGEINPILPSSPLFTLPDNHKVVFVHKNTGYEHYIVYDEENKQFWYYDETAESTWHLRSILTISFTMTGINAVGNTLIILGENSMRYVLWADGQYRLLGDHLPHISLSFGLQGHPRLYSVSGDTHSTFTINFDSMSEAQLYTEFSENNKTRITEQIMAKVNKFVADQSVKKGRFCLPFFVRYALRLYDGSLAMHSAPVLMNPCTTNNPIVYWTEIHGDSSGYNNATCNMMLVACDLDYKYYSALSDDFSSWTDIVKSVEVFISKPIYTYDINGKIKNCAEADDFDSVFIGKLYANGSTPQGQAAEDKYISPIDGNAFDYYAQWEYCKIYAMYFKSDRTAQWGCFRLPEFTGNKVSESLSDTSLFYKLCSIDISSLSSTRQVIAIDDDYLESLVSREVMTDDYLSHDKLGANYAHAYNSRLSLSGITRSLFKGFYLNEMLAYCNRRYNYSKGENNTLSITAVIGSFDKYAVIVNIRENGEEKEVLCNGSSVNIDFLQNFLSDEVTYYNPATGQAVTEMSKESWGCYLFYPNANAYRMSIIATWQNPLSGHNMQIYDIDLKPHDQLNGAYALLSYGSVRSSHGTYSGDLSESTDYVSVFNKIYTSEVDNPFVFPALGINTVGTGSILAICSAVKALSQGQFGQFPLYAFTDEGVWALEPSDTGSYKAVQPVTRDVCNNPDSITQIDTAVLFTTDRGIMLISGSNSQCISDSINSVDAFDIDVLPGITSLVDDRIATVTDFVPFKTFLLNAKMLYDYTNQRIIVYNPNRRYAYVYSLKSKQWGLMQSDIKDSINSYPDALALVSVPVTASDAPSDVSDTPSDVSEASPSESSSSNESETTPSAINTVFNFSQTVTGDAPVNGLLITRPLKLDAPDVLKTIDTVIQRGYFRRGHVKTILYGSRDLFNWKLIYSSTDHYLLGFRGTPYKYFRIALLCSLTKDESIFGCTVQYTPRLLNQPR